MRIKVALWYRGGATNIFGLKSGPAGASVAAGVSAAFVSSAALASLASVISTMVKKVVVRPSSHADNGSEGVKEPVAASVGLIYLRSFKTVTVSAVILPVEVLILPEDIIQH